MRLGAIYPYSLFTLPSASADEPVLPYSEQSSQTCSQLALILSVLQDNTDRVSELFEKGLDPDQPFNQAMLDLYDDNAGQFKWDLCEEVFDQSHALFLESAHSDRYPGILASFLRDESRPLWLAIQTNNPDMMRTLLQSGADHSIRYPENLTALCYAVTVGRASIVNTLLEFNADPNLTCMDLSPLMIAVLHQHEELIISLINHGADQYWQNSRGISASTMAIKQAYAPLLKLLGPDTFGSENQTISSQSPFQY